MNHTKHTPGPWTTNQWWPTPRHGTDSDGEDYWSQFFSIRAPNGYSLATVSYQASREDGAQSAPGQGTASWAENEANANLFAAAPELLEALMELRDWYTEHTRLPACKANAAIAKATGGAA